MNGFIERLRQQKEREWAEAERLERQRREKVDREAEASRRYEEELRARNDAAKNQAKDYFERSDFPRLLGELQRITGINLIIYLYRFRGRLVYNKDEGNFERGRYYMPRTVDPNDLSFIKLGYFKNKDYRHPPTFLGRKIGIERPSYLGFLIEVTPEGNLIAYGRNRIILLPNQWKSNPDVQEETLEKVYTSPFPLQFEWRESGGVPSSSGGDR